MLITKAAALSLISCLVSLLRFLVSFPNSEIKSLSFTKKYDEFKEMRVFGRTMYVGKLLSKPLNIALAGVVAAYLSSIGSGFASNFLGFETVIYFAGLTGVEILAAVMVGVIGPNRSLNKIAEGLTIPGKSRKLIWKESQDEKVEEKRLDSKEGNGDNEREDTH